MNRRDFCALPLILTGCGGEMEYQLQPSPTRANSQLHSDVPGYAERSWTPSLTLSTPGDLSVTFLLQLGRYIKLGSLIVCFFSLDVSSWTFLTGSGNLQLTGLPFPALLIPGTGAAWSSGNSYWAGVNPTNGYTDLMPRLGGAASYSEFIMSGDAQASVLTITSAHVPTGSTFVLGGVVIYIADLT